MTGPNTKAEQKKEGPQYSVPINFFNPTNAPLKKLTEEEKAHISRHIPRGSYLEFEASWKRQQNRYEETSCNYELWKFKGKKEKDFPGPPCYVCSDCQKIAFKLGL